MRLHSACIQDLEPGLPCPEEVTWIVENTYNRVSVGTCDDHKAQTVALVDPECVRVMSVKEWVAEGRPMV